MEVVSAGDIDFVARWRRLDSIIDSDDGQGESRPPAPIIAIDQHNVRWLTGLRSSNAMAALVGDSCYLVTDSRYGEQAQGLSAPVVVSVGRSLREELAALIARDHPDAGEWVEDGEALARARSVKDSTEVALLRQASQISIQALEKSLPKFAVGMSEVECARILELEMGRLGAEDRAFPSIVASGPNSAIPHHSPGFRRLEVGDFLKIDFGACFDGYMADCTRTFVVGREPTSWQLELHADVEAAAAHARSHVLVGMTGAEVDALSRDYFEARGLSDKFLHGLGHGVGLEIHERPFLILNSKDVVESGSVFTIEPGLYCEGRGGVRIEDTCVIYGETLEVLTESDRGLRRIA